MWNIHQARSIFPKTTPLAVISKYAIRPVRCSVIEQTPNLEHWYLSFHMWPFEGFMDDTHLDILQAYNMQHEISIAFWDKEKNSIIEGFVEVSKVASHADMDLMEVTVQCHSTMSIVQDIDSLHNTMVNIKSSNINARLLASGIIWESTKHTRRFVV